METKTLVNLNTAAEDELTQVPGVGPVLAERMMATRPFDSLDDVRRVPGIGPSLLGKIAPYATVEEGHFAGMHVSVDENGSEGLSFVDVTPVEDEDERHVNEVPADLIPLPPLPAVPPWNEDEVEPEIPPAAEEAPEAELVHAPSWIEDEAELETPLAAEEAPEAGIPLWVEDETEDESETPLVTDEAPEEPLAPAAEIEDEAEPESPLIVEEAMEEAQPEPTKPSSMPITRSQLIWVSLGVFAVTLLIALALSLGILAGINGGLDYASPNDVAQVSREVATLRGQAEALEQSLSNVQTRLDNLETLSGRVDTLETQQGALQRDVDALSTQAETFSSQIQNLEQETTTLNTQMESVQQQSGRFQQVMDGLRDLLNDIFTNE